MLLCWGGHSKAQPGMTKTGSVGLMDTSACNNQIPFFSNRRRLFLFFVHFSGVSILTEQTYTIAPSSLSSLTSVDLNWSDSA